MSRRVRVAAGLSGLAAATALLGAPEFGLVTVPTNDHTVVTPSPAPRRAPGLLGAAAARTHPERDFATPQKPAKLKEAGEISPASLRTAGFCGAVASEGWDGGTQAGRWTGV